MKNLVFLSALALSTLNGNSAIFNQHTVTTYLGVNTILPPDGSSKIQVALLFDTSNSMDGLIEQAKSRLWDIVNTLTTLKYQGKTPTIEISLYEYGNDGLSVEGNYIRQITGLSTDLDLISEKLFSLRTNGGSEYCGAVIHNACQELKWDDSNNTMKLIYIAGNEGFDQGTFNYKTSINDALKKQIYVNTIYCGNRQDGIKLFWYDGAEIGKGKYFNIDSDKKVEYVETPYDKDINACNSKLNQTYISYGKQGYSKKQSQSEQDANASKISSANATERVVSKSKGVYKNSTWDLVDNLNDDPSNIDKIKTEDLPAEYKGKTKEEIKVLVAQKAKEREQIQKQISELAVKRQQYITEKTKSTNKQDDLGTAIKSSIVKIASTKGYVVVE